MSEESRDPNETERSAGGPPSDSGDDDRADPESDRTGEDPRDPLGFDEALQTETAELFADEVPTDLSVNDPDEEAVLSTNQLFGLLSSPGNRFILTYLLRVDTPATYSDLVGYVVDHVEPPGEMTKEKYRGRIAARLVHSNLPQLEDAGLIDHDTDANQVTSRPSIETVAPYLALAMSRPDIDQ